MEHKLSQMFGLNRRLDQRINWVMDMVMVFKATFNTISVSQMYIVVVSFIGGGNRENHRTGAMH
jgi:hypothetical protein